jgi:hypothetical protein
MWPRRQCPEFAKRGRPTSNSGTRHQPPDGAGWTKGLDANADGTYAATNGCERKTHRGRQGTIWTIPIVVELLRPTDRARKSWCISDEAFRVEVFADQSSECNCGEHKSSLSEVAVWGLDYMAIGTLDSSHNPGVV